jgi:hypothetical protein
MENCNNRQKIIQLSLIFYDFFNIFFFNFFILLIPIFGGEMIFLQILRINLHKTYTEGVLKK